MLFLKDVCDPVELDYYSFVRQVKAYNRADARSAQACSLLNAWNYAMFVVQLGCPALSRGERTEFLLNGLKN